MKKLLLIFLAIFCVPLVFAAQYIEMEENHPDMFESYTIYKVLATDKSFNSNDLNTLNSYFIEMKGHVNSWHLEREINMSIELNKTIGEWVNFTYNCTSNITNQTELCNGTMFNITGYNITNSSKIIWAEIENFDGIELNQSEWFRYRIVGEHTPLKNSILIDNIPIFDGINYTEYVLWNVSYSFFRDSQNISSNPGLILPYQSIQLNGSGTAKWLYAQNGSVSYNDNDDFVFNNDSSLICGFQTYPSFKKECDTAPIGLEHYWTFDESSGNLIDAISGYNGTVSGATQGVSGIIHNSYNFSSDDDISISAITVSGDITFTWWEYKNSNANYGERWSQVTQLELRDHGTDGTPEITGGEVNTATNATPVGEWYMLTWAYNSTSKELRYFYNGEFKENWTRSNDIEGSNPVYMGERSGSSYPLDARLDDFRFYSRTLSDTEIQTLYEKSMNVYYGNQQTGTILPSLNFVNITNKPLYYDKTANFTVNYTKGDFNGTLSINWSVDGTNVYYESINYVSSGQNSFYLNYDNYSCENNVSALIIINDTESKFVTDTDSVIVSTYPLSGSVTYNGTLVPQARYVLYYEHNGSLIQSGLSNNSGTWTSSPLCGFNVTGSACVYGAILNVSNLSQTIDTITTRTCNAYWGVVQ